MLFFVSLQTNFSPHNFTHQTNQIKQQKAMEGSISKDRLRDEVVAPYKQNWIGLFSMVIVILSTIVIKFPEVIETPIIKIPDL